MDVREATQTARKYVADVFADDEISNIALEEVEFHEESGVWSVTLSFLRPTGTTDNLDIIAPALRRGKKVQRFYKILNVEDRSGRVISVKHRVIEKVG